MANWEVMLLFKLIYLLVITRACYASQHHDSGDNAILCDYETVMKVIEKLERRVEVVEMLEKRVEALESEYAQQRAEITGLKAAIQRDQDRQQHTVAEENEFETTYSEEHAATGTKSRIRRASPELTIAFYAGVQAEVHHLGQGQNVPFDNVVTNVGNAYDSRVGVFKAPVAGVYVFSTTIQTYHRDTALYAFALNGHPITVIYVNGDDSWADADSQTIILQLKAGEDVSVQHTESDHGLYGGHHSVFSGFLLSMSGDGPISIVG